MGMLVKFRHLLAIVVGVFALCVGAVAHAATPQIDVYAGVLFSPTSTLSNNGTFNYSVVDVSSTSYAYFTVVNNGDAALNLSGLPVLSGPNAAEFKVDPQAQLTVAANSSTSFYVSITPQSLGAKNATLTITSNDPHASPFVVQLTASVDHVITLVYEDADDGTTKRWKPVNETGQAMSITSVLDDINHGRAMKITTTDYNRQNFSLMNRDGVNAWNNTDMRVLKFDLKTVNDVNIFARVRAVGGTNYYLTYTFDNPNSGLVGGRYAYIHLDPALKDGAWHTITRDLAADLAAFLPNVQIQSVMGFQFGSPDARVDNIMLTKIPLAAYQVSGTVRDINGAPIANTKMTLTPYGQTTLTDANGLYAFTGLANGNYTVAASNVQYTFNPALKNVTVLNGNMVVDFNAELNPVTVYEDAEDGTTKRWKLSGANIQGTAITNVAEDVSHGKAIEISTPDINNQNYVLYAADGQNEWHNAIAKTLRFDMKTTQEVYAHVKVSTQNGTYYLMYTFNYPTGLKFGRYASIHLDPALKDGSWHTVVRDLQTDLNSLVPNVTINSVEGFLVGSTNVRFDNIELLDASVVHKIAGTVVDNQNQPLAGVTISISGIGSKTITDNAGAYNINSLPDGNYTITPTLSGYTFNPVATNVTVAGSDGQASFTGSPSNTFVYEDAEDGNVSRWRLTGSNLPGTSITNVADDVNHGKAIAIATPDINSQDYILYGSDGVSNWHNTQATKLSFDLKTSNETYVYAVVQTVSNKTYYLMYSFNFRPGLLMDKYASFNLDPAFKDAAWHTVTRDLQTDLTSLAPGETISSVEYAMVGSTDVRVDNVVLSK